MDFQDFEIEMFDLYLKKQMGQDELLQFEKKIESDSDFAKKYQNYLEIIGIIKFAGREELKKRIAKEGEVKYFSNQWGKKWTIAYAAIFLLFIGLFFVFENFLKEKIQKTNPVQTYENIEEVGENNVNNAPQKKEKQDTQIESADDENEIPLTNEESDKTADSEIEESSEEDARNELADKLSDTPENNMTQNGNAPSPPSATEMSKARTAEKVYDVATEELLTDTLYNSILTQILSDSLVAIGNIDVKVKLLKSPLNSKVYKYWVSGQNHYIEIYGLPYPTPFKVFLLNNEMYFLSAQSLFKFSTTRSYLPLQQISDKELRTKLEKLNEN
jgi:hypothetical protein